MARRRPRWLAALASAAAALAAAGALAVVVPAAASANTAPNCPTSWLKITVGPPNGYAGGTYREIGYQNVANQTCYLYGRPGVAMRYQNHQLGRASYWEPGQHPTYVQLVPGAEAESTLQIDNVGNYTPPSVCKQKLANAVRIIPPNDYTSQRIPLSVYGCSTTGPYAPIFMRTWPVQLARS